MDTFYITLEQIDRLLEGIGRGDGNEVIRVIQEVRASEVEGLKDWKPDPQSKARKTDPSPSKEAALANQPTKGCQRWIILECYWFHPLGLSAHEALAILNRDRDRIINDSLTTRISELVRGGWLEDSGLKRMGTHGIEITVWRITRKGLREFGTEGIEIEME